MAKIIYNKFDKKQISKLSEDRFEKRTLLVTFYKKTGTITSTFFLTFTGKNITILSMKESPEGFP